MPAKGTAEEVVASAPTDTVAQTNTPVTEEKHEQPAVAEQAVAKAPVQEETVAQNVVPLKKTASSSENTTKLDFSVSGDMNLELAFHIAGQTVNLHLDENEGFVIELAHGARFTIPLDVSGKAKKSA